MKSREPFVRIVPVKIPGTSRFRLKAILIDPEDMTRIKGKKSKKERRRIRKRYEATKRPRHVPEKSGGRGLRHAGNGGRR